jgi:hypothetical protein
MQILICFECAARHRSYGTHISFIRSINLDKWNRKQLKSIEITGNKFARERFNELGLSKVAGVYDYSSDLLQKYKSEIADKVKDSLSLENFTPASDNKTNNQQPIQSIKKVNEVNFDDIPLEEVKPQPKENKPEFKEATKINIVDIKVISSKEETTKKKKGNVNKIQKVDFDFDFDNFNDANFSSFTGNNNENAKNETNFDEEFNSSSKKKVKKEEDEEVEDFSKLKISKEEINKKFANKKAISSDDYARLEEDPSQSDNYKSKISSMKYSKAISSSDLYGEPEEGIHKYNLNLDTSSGFGSRLKDLAFGFTMKAAEKAKEVI